MRNKLSDHEMSLLTDVISRYRPDLLTLVDGVRNGVLSSEQRNKLRHAISDEFIAAGLDAEDEPTRYGDQLEDLIAKLGHIGEPL